jgi:hypothetical protein
MLFHPDSLRLCYSHHQFPIPPFGTSINRIRTSSLFQHFHLRNQANAISEGKNEQKEKDVVHEISILKKLLGVL